MKTGWLSDGTNNYYMDPSTGKMAVNGWKLIDKIYYRFDASGHMVEKSQETPADYDSNKANSTSAVSTSTSATSSGVSVSTTTGTTASAGSGASVVSGPVAGVTGTTGGGAQAQNNEFINGGPSVNGAGTGKSTSSGSNPTTVSNPGTPENPTGINNGLTAGKTGGPGH